MTLYRMVSRGRLEAQARASPGSLDAAARAINDHLLKSAKAEGTSDYHRVQAGMKLAEVRKQLPHGEWRKWCRANIQRSIRDINRLLKIVGAADPDAALDQDRAATKGRMQEHRVKTRARARALDAKRDARASLLDEVSNHVAFLARQFLALDDDDQAHFMALTGLVFLSKEKRHAG